VAKRHDTGKTDRRNGQKRQRLPGLRNIWGYPIKIRIDMLTTGIRTPVGIKIAGPDLNEIDRLAKDIEQLARQVNGNAQRRGRPRAGRKIY
jgi:Cu/Ag efflux pump CusA